MYVCASRARTHTHTHTHTWVCLSSTHAMNKDVRRHTRRAHQGALALNLRTTAHMPCLLPTRVLTRRTRMHRYPSHELPHTSRHPCPVLPPLPPFPPASPSTRARVRVPPACAGGNRGGLLSLGTISREVILISLSGCRNREGGRWRVRGQSGTEEMDGSARRR